MIRQNNSQHYMASQNRKDLNTIASEALGIFHSACSSGQKLGATGMENSDTQSVKLAACNEAKDCRRGDLALTVSFQVLLQSVKNGRFIPS
jgi:hypothetical protein